MPARWWWTPLAPDERQIIAVIRAALKSRAKDEDAEVIPAGPGKLAASVDTMSASSDIPAGMRLRDAARKALIAPASDLVAKGVRPAFCLVSVTAPHKLGSQQARQIASGVAQAAGELGVEVLGGDTGRGAELSITACMMGRAKRMVLRGGARAGDLVFATGPFGHAAAGLHIIQNGPAAGAFAAAAKRAFCRPQLRLGFAMAASGRWSASVDSSDGLLACLQAISHASGKKVLLEHNPASDGLRKFAQQRRLDPERMALQGGEEYEVVFCAAPASKAALSGLAKRHGVPLRVIGRVEGGAGTYFGSRRLSGRGWVHK